MKEHYYDKLLNIKTAAEIKGIHKSYHYHRYEPTPYSALEVLFQNYELSSNDRIVDFGSGKGRLNFFIHYLFQAAVIGVEMSEIFHQEALKNKTDYLKRSNKNSNKIQFCNCLAEEYEIQPLENRFYFFNPFSIQVFMKIIHNILESADHSAREIEIVLYYPSEDYIYYLESYTSFKLKREVRLPDLYENNQNERFLIYHLSD
ncbi:methyltransferase [Anaerobacillus sp. CMMVII]|uniref:SAM-dependent methyltransferase n=1 Tax=Anaerobacillus sp. CMMVII TaxID=2755588 RepID=UPI0021B806F9|nr:SAM-dependent methyltransferase [Anaerobacillus sp. CMMVII]MCT8136880.1 methyltransferase [Anaerobacillus sp. CMMVII]